MAHSASPAPPPAPSGARHAGSRHTAARAVTFMLAGLAALAVLLVAAVLVLTRTDVGRERALRFALDRINRQLGGQLQVGSVEGNLLTGATLRDVALLDRAGRPLLRAGRVRARYDLRALLSGRVVISALTLVDPVLRLVQSRGGGWNWEGVFSRPGAGAPADTAPGAIDQVLVRDVRVVGGRVIVRQPWSPDSALAPAARDSAARAALGGGTRVAVVRDSAGGLVRVTELRDLGARLPFVRWAADHARPPAEPAVVAQVAHLDMVASVFRPPVARVRDASGTVFVGDDSLWVRDLALALPRSRVTGRASYAFDPGALRLALRGTDVALADFQWLYPPLPDRGTATLAFGAVIPADGPGEYTVGDARIVSGGALLAGRLGLRVGDTLRFASTDLRFRDVGTALLERLVPGLEVPRRGALTGAVALDGPLTRLRLAADLTFADAVTGRTGLAARGVVGFGGGAPRADSLRLRMRALPVAWAEPFVPDLPVGGTVSGAALVSGAPDSALAGTFDLAYRARGTTSELAGAGTVALAGGAERARVDLRLRAERLALDALQPFVPALDLRGTAAGEARVRGPLRDLAFETSLRLAGGGAAARGRLALAGPRPAYDVTLRLRDLNANAAIAAAPPTALTGTVRVAGRGFDPAALDARVAADLDRLVVDSVPVGTLVARAALAGGRLAVDTFALRAPFGTAAVEGTFGLTPATRGTLAYRAQVRSLAALGRWLRRADLAAQDAPAAGGSLGGVLDSLAGSVVAAGTVQGSVDRFDVRGRAGTEGLLSGANALGAARVEYAWLGGGTPTPRAVVAVRLDSVAVAGRVLDSAAARVVYARPGGSVDADLFASDALGLHVAADFALRPGNNALVARDVRLRLDTLAWSTPRPATIRWGGNGVAVDGLVLRSPDGGLVAVDGRVPPEGRGRLAVRVAALPLAPFAALAASPVPVAGRLWLTGWLDGSLRRPELAGALGVADPVVDGTALPDLRTAFRYDDRLLYTETLFTRGRGATGRGATLAAGRAWLPLDLALGGPPGPRLPERPLYAELRGDSIPLAPLAPLTGAVTLRGGTASGLVTVRGTYRRPVLGGGVRARVAALGIPALGVTLRDAAAALAFDGDRLRVDSLVGYSGGPVRVRGGVDLAALTRPVLDLGVFARDAVVLDNAYGRLRADAALAVRGPLDAVAVTGRATVLGGVVRVPAPEARTLVDLRDPAVFAVVDTAVAEELELLPNPLLANVRVDVGLTVSRDTWARSAEANVEVYGDLDVHLDRRAGEFAVQGALQTDRGDYTFLGRRFVLTRGSATFTGSPDLDPVLQLLGLHEVRLAGAAPLEIGVVVGGTLESPRVTLESDAQPPVPQSDLLSYLAFGRASTSLLQFQGPGLAGGGISGGRLAGSVAALATRQLASVALGVLVEQAERDLARDLGVDALNISPADLPAELSLGGAGLLLRGTELEAGKYVDRRTFLAAQLRPSFSAVPGFRLEHRFPSNFRLRASFESRFLPRRPTLERGITPASAGVFGALLGWRRDW